MMARIMWKKSVVLESDMCRTFQNIANELRTRAEITCKQLAGSGEGDIVIALDVLVPGYFR
jgi:hypothetical protein